MGVLRLISGAGQGWLHIAYILESGCGKARITVPCAWVCMGANPPHGGGGKFTIYIDLCLSFELVFQPALLGATAATSTNMHRYTTHILLAPLLAQVLHGLSLSSLLYSPLVTLRMFWFALPVHTFMHITQLPRRRCSMFTLAHLPCTGTVQCQHCHVRLNYVACVVGGAGPLSVADLAQELVAW